MYLDEAENAQHTRTKHEPWEAPGVFYFNNVINTYRLHHLHISQQIAVTDNKDSRAR